MGRTILVVDDEKDIVSFLERFLSRFNLNVLTATGGVDAIKQYHATRADCVLLDIQMPDKDGLTVLKELKEYDENVKVIMITGKEEKEFQNKAKEYGAIDYITKPLDLSDLRDKIEKYLT